MDKDNDKHQDQFEASLPLPISRSNDKPQQDAAADLIRKRVEAAYQDEPSAKAEAKDIDTLGQTSKLSKHQQFIYDLTSSGKPLHEINTSWHEYYAALSEAEKHEVWQEFYSTHAEAARFTDNIPSLEPKPETVKRQYTRPATKTIGRSLYAPKPAKRLIAAIPQSGPASHLRSLLFGMSVGLVVVIIFLFSFFNERFIAPFIQPSRLVTNTPIINTNGSTPIGPNPEIVIPKINVEIPVVYDVSTIDEASVDKALESGVVHYADTALPGQNGNAVIVGHSSNNIFNPGKYKFAFVLLSKLDSGDTFYLQKDGKRYTYQVYKKQIVSPTDVSVLGPADKPATASLITCDPPGTSNNRLVVTGEQIDPAVSTNTAQAPAAKLATQSQVIPGNSPTLWSRFWRWMTY